MNILQINSSARSEGSESTRLAGRIVARLLESHPEARLVRRDLATDPQPVLDEAALQALFSPAETRTAEQAARVAIDDRAIAQVQAADTIVLGVPMYNLTIPAQLKHWIDAIARAGVTFRYTENGPVGLLTGKTVYVALARGGRYRDSEMDTQVPYLKTVLGFLGMTDVRFLYVEGVAMGEESLAAAREAAERELASVVAQS
ncbi:MAG: FMN-dependent NADH-azoreductase [Rhodocyclaceae bacterium]|nr:FMN-dependent NADH-azoreductase [Rhodocyclaceae bacterium]